MGRSRQQQEIDGFDAWHTPLPRLSSPSASAPAEPPRAAFPRAASELALRRLEHANARAGHENAGFLSVSRGFVPALPPLTKLDARFLAWDELAHDLPRLYQTLQLRKRVEQLPVLDAMQLDDREVLRATALLAIVAHAYWYVDCRPPAALPDSVRVPWAALRRRLGRTQEVISYIDLVVYNWKVRDPGRKDALVVENLDLLFPTIGNEAERIFYLTQLEILHRTSSVPRMVAAAQGAVLREDQEELEAQLVGIIDGLARVVSSSLPKINPNPYASAHVDPVLWAKTVAPFAVPFHRGDQGPSGTSSPLFNTLDIFFGRTDHASFLGREIKQLRATYPRAWQVFLGALTEVSVARFIEERGSRSLRSAFREAFELYAGESGFLGRHRMKVYGYLELAFKVGRSVTIGGFSGAFTDRTWDVVDRELSHSQSERTKGHPPFVHRARVVPNESTDVGSGIRKITLDVSRAGVRYRGGDRCLILPENDRELVERTLRALGAHGNERVVLTSEWRAYARDRAELANQSEVSVRELLSYGAIRPVSPRLAEALHARTQSPVILDAIERGVTERWELWELLDLLASRGHAPTSLWSSDGPPTDALSRLIPPQRYRTYSVSSAPDNPLRRAESTLQLTVGQVQYAADDVKTGCPAAAQAPAPTGCPMHASSLRRGTSSSFLSRADAEHEVPFRMQQSDSFRLPDDPDVPIVMFAGGSGIAPFRAFLQERRRASNARSWLFLSLRTPNDFTYSDEFAPAVASGALALDVAFTREGGRVALGEGGRLTVRAGATTELAERMRDPHVRALLWHLAQPKEEGGGGAVFYVCGRSGFARTVLESLKSVFQARVEDPAAAAHLLYRLVGDRRLLQEVHTDAHVFDESPRLFDMSDVVQHNDREHGYWIVIDRVVYDMTEFVELHPGGRRVVQAYAGLDASHGFARAHQGRADVDAMRESYRIGALRTLKFEEYAVPVETPTGVLTVDTAQAYRTFVRALSLVVEMQNALAADQSLRDEPHGDAPGERSAFQLQRAVETHRRFLHQYLPGLINQVLPTLWGEAQGVFFPDISPAWMRASLRVVQSSEAVQETERLAEDALAQFERLGERGLILGTVEAFEEHDVWCLKALKHALSLAVREFELHEVDVRERGALRIRRACMRLVGVLRRYYSSSSQASMKLLRADARATCAPSSEIARRLHTGTHWILEEDAAQRTATLRRTPIAARSLSALSEENERVLRCLTSAHRSYGLVVDTRQARMRNDPGFEDAMAKLRRELTSHFQRTAVLLESSIGELQVTRLGRDDQREVIATRNESAAFKFAQGGA